MVIGNYAYNTHGLLGRENWFNMPADKSEFVKWVKEDVLTKKTSSRTVYTKTIKTELRG